MELFRDNDPLKWGVCDIYICNELYKVVLCVVPEGIYGYNLGPERRSMGDAFSSPSS